MEKNNSIVYLYGFSLRHKSQLKDLLKIINEQLKATAIIKLVLVHDGVIGISKKSKPNSIFLALLNLPIEIYALEPDLLARGIDVKTKRNSILLINYDKLVDILAETPKICSWV